MHGMQIKIKNAYNKFTPYDEIFTFMRSSFLTWYRD
jgi:hypothetical protein